MLTHSEGQRSRRCLLRRSDSAVSTMPKEPRWPSTDTRRKWEMDFVSGTKPGHVPCSHTLSRADPSSGASSQPPPLHHPALTQRLPCEHFPRCCKRCPDRERQLFFIDQVYGSLGRKGHPHIRAGSQLRSMQPRQSWHGQARRRHPQSRKSEASPADDRGTDFLILLAGDPHVLEGGERAQDGAAHPGAVCGIGAGGYLDRVEEAERGEGGRGRARGAGGVEGSEERGKETRIKILLQI